MDYPHSSRGAIDMQHTAEKQARELGSGPGRFGQPPTHAEMGASLAGSNLVGSSAPIAQELERLKREVEETHAAAAHLIGRISPVLGPERAEKAGNTATPTPAMSALADNLDSLAYSVRGLRARIVDAIERIEL